MVSENAAEYNEWHFRQSWLTRGLMIGQPALQRLRSQ